MSDRYTQIFLLPAQQYTADFRVTFGALLRDNATGQVFAQLKLINRSGASLPSVNVQLQPIDWQGKQVGSVINQTYTAPSPVAGIEFGSQILVPMPVGTTSFFVNLVPHTQSVPYPAYQASAQQPAVPAGRIETAAPVSKFLSLLPLLISLILAVIDPVIYVLRMLAYQVSVSNITFSIGSYLIDAFYTHTLLALIPLLFLLLCTSRDARAKLASVFRTICISMLGLQALIAIVVCILTRTGAQSLPFSSFLQNFPGALSLHYLLLIPKHARNILEFIREILYFIPTVLCLIFSGKLKKS